MGRSKLYIEKGVVSPTTDRADINIMLNAFDNAINGALTQHGMVDGIRDAFIDESGIDTETGGSSGQTYDSGNDLYQPVQASTLEIDYCEYSSDELAQADWITSMSAGLDSDTKLLLHANGQDGGKEIIDSGDTGHIVTQVATAILHPGRFNKSGSFNGITSKLGIDYDHADWDVSTNWTIDFWVKHTDHVGDELYISQYADAEDHWELFHRDGSGFRFQHRVSNAYVIQTPFAGEITDSNWHHICIIRKDGQYWGIYVDGIQVSYLDDVDTGTNTGNLEIGGGTLFTKFAGLLDEIRISNVVRFSANPNVGLTNTITVPTSEYTSDANTKLLLHLNGNVTDDSDSITGGHTITNTDVDFIPKFGSSCGWFDGDSDYLSIPDHIDWDIFNNNTDNKTIDFWVKHTDHSGTEAYMGQGEDNDNRWFIVHQHGAGLYFYFRENATTRIDIGGAGEITDIDWHHITICKVVNEYGVYLDGVQVLYGTTDISDTFNAELRIGARNDGYYFDGYMDEIRIVNGNGTGGAGNPFGASPVDLSVTGAVADTIIVPTSEHTSDSTTKLLLHMNSHDVSGDGGNGNYHIPTFYGTCQIDTAQKKWGVSSFYFDGNSDYIIFPDSPDWDIVGSNSDDWTIDLWVKLASLGVAYNILEHFEDPDNRWDLYVGSNNKIGFQARDTGTRFVDFVATTAITNTNWHHIALCKVANEYSIYLDGTQIGYESEATVNTLTGTLQVGRYGGGSQYFSGYMDEIRIQHSNILNASPADINVTGISPDTIIVPTGEYGEVDLQSYSEGTLKQQGSYSLKIVAGATDSLNEYVRNTFSSKDLSSYNSIKFDIRASREGTNLQMRIHDTGGEIQSYNIEIGTGEADTWITKTWDISAITGAKLDAIDYIELKIINADSVNTIYLDNIYAYTSPQNMTLISDEFTASAQPDSCRLVLFEEDVNAITLGTDLKAYISRDGGTTWSQVTLADEGDYALNKRIITGTVDISGQPSGTTMEYKVETLNNKNLKLHGAGMLWD